MSETLEDVKKNLSRWLVAADQLTPSLGLSTSWPAVDHFLMWRGIPQGALSLFYGAAGRGATSLWIDTAQEVINKKKWVAWVNAPQPLTVYKKSVTPSPTWRTSGLNSQRHGGFQSASPANHEGFPHVSEDLNATSLNPWNLRRRGVDLSRLLVVSTPRDLKQLLWALQELMSLSLFEMIGCDLGLWQLKEYQLLKLKRLARTFHCALVFISRRQRLLKSSCYALVMNFEKNGIRIERALQRSTPYLVQRRSFYADLMPQHSPPAQLLRH